MTQIIDENKATNPSTDAILEQRLTAFRNRYEAIPVKGKRPLFKGWRTWSISEDSLRTITVQHTYMQGCGARTGHLAIVDYDIPEADLLAACEDAVMLALPSSPIRRVGSKGYCDFYLNRNPIEKIVVKGTKSLPDGATITRKVEFLGCGQQVVIAGIHPDTGMPYHYLTEATPFNTPLKELPEVTEDEIRNAAQLVAAEMENFGFTVESADANAIAEFRPSSGWPFELKQFDAMIRLLDPGSFNRQGSGSWSTIAAGFKYANIWDANGEDVTLDERREMFLEWSRGDLWKGKAPENWKSDDDAGRLFDDMDPPAAQNNGAGPGTIVKLAKDAGYKGPTRVGLMDFAHRADPDHYGDSVFPFDLDGDSTTLSANLYDPWKQYFAPRFPFWVLPPVLRNFVEGHHKEMGADPSAIAMACFGAMSMAVSQEFKLKLTTSHFALPRLWLMFVGDPSTQKTPVQNIALAPLVEIHANYQREHDMRIKHLKASGADKDTIKHAEMDMALKVLINKATLEGLANICAHQNRGVGLNPDEWMSFQGSFDKYKSSGAGGGDRADMLEFYNGGTKTIEFATKPARNVENFAGAIMTGIQPTRMREIHGFDSDGLIQRFVPIIMRGRKLGVEWDTTEVTKEYRRLIRRMFQQNRAEVMQLSKEAKTEFAKIKRLVFDYQGNDTMASSFRYFVGKLETMWAAFAILLQLAWGPEPDMGQPWVLSRENAERASAIIMDFVMPHAFAFYRLFTAPDMSRDRAIAACVFRAWSEGKTVITTKELQRGTGDNGLRGVAAKDMPGALADFVAGGWLDPIQGREWYVNRWTINPAIAAFKDRAEAWQQQHAELLAKFEVLKGRKGDEEPSEGQDSD